MTTEQAQQQTKTERLETAPSGGAVAKFQPPRLPYHPVIEERFGVKAAEWKALVEAVFPAAKSSDAVVLALSYCKARKLDPFKRVVHIVPIYDREKRKYVETVWPGIAEHRTTAFRTKQYAGSDACRFGAMLEQTFENTNDQGERRNITVKFPEWAQLTVYRMIDGQRVPIPGPQVYWLETYSRQGRTSIPNDMWQKRPVGQLEKCAEAAALRRAFPEELGDEPTADEAGGLHVGPDNAKDITPGAAQQETSEVAAEAERNPYALITTDGEERTFDETSDAAQAMEAILREAARAGKDALTGIWETNAGFIQELRDRDDGQYAEDLVAIYGKLLGDLKVAEAKPAPKAAGDGAATNGAKKQTATQKSTTTQQQDPKPAEAKSAPAGGLVSPFDFTGPERQKAWVTFVDKLEAAIKTAANGTGGDILSQWKHEWGAICEHRPDDMDRINLALDLNMNPGT